MIRQVEVRLALRFLPLLIGLLLLLQLFFPSRVWVAALVVLGGGWLVGYLWARSLARHLHLVREVRFGWTQVGDRLEERFTLANHGLAPALWVEIVDHSTLPGYSAGRVTSVGLLDSLQWQTEGVCTRRGLYMLGPTSLRAGDPLGIYTLRLHDPRSAALLVMPPVLPLPAIEIAPAGRAGEGRRPRAGALERTVSAAAVRAYQAGDAPRWIHWPTSAHQNALWVRLFDSTPASDWWIVLDLDRRVQAGQGSDATEEHGVLLAASLADRGLRAGRAVGLVMYGEDLVWLPPAGAQGQRAQGQRMAILRALALATSGTLSLADLLTRAQPAFRHGCSLIAITPAVGGEWVEALLPLQKRGVALTVLLLDPPVRTEPVPRATQVAATNRTLALLANWGIPRYLISRDLFDVPEARPGRQGRWEWRLFDGRAIPVRRPGDLCWRRLG